MNGSVLQLCAFPKVVQDVVDSRLNICLEKDIESGGVNPEDVRAILARSNSVIPEDIVDGLPNLSILSICGVGYDLVPVELLRQKNITIAHTPSVLDSAVAEMTVGLLLSLLREIPKADRFVRNGNWGREAFPLTYNLAGKTVGILGMGRIGQAIARRLEAFDVEIIYFSRSDKKLKWAFELNPGSLAGMADILIVSLPGGPDTNGMVSSEVLKSLGKSGFLVNISRGSVLDQDALIAALDDRTIAGAALDVFVNEPDVDPRLFTLDNVVLSPHVASATMETRLHMIGAAIDNIENFLSGEGEVTAVFESGRAGAAIG